MRLVSSLVTEGYGFIVSDRLHLTMEVALTAMQQKLQRRIANARGVAPDAALVSPTRTSVEDVRNDAHRPDTLVSSTSEPREGGTAVVQKRKYRRHPKVCSNQCQSKKLQSYFSVG